MKARSEYHTQLTKMSFDEIFDLTAGVYFNFYNINEDTQTVVGRGEEGTRYVTPDLCCYWEGGKEGAREQCEDDK